MQRLQLHFAFVQFVSLFGVVASTTMRHVSTPETEANILIQQEFAQNELGLKECHSAFRHIEFQCWPTEYRDEDVIFKISENHEYILTCDSEFHYPLGSVSRWTCRDGTFYTPASNCREDSYVPVECVEVELPEAIYLDQVISVSSKTILDCDPDDPGDIYRQELMHLDHNFTFPNSPGATVTIPFIGCRSLVDANGSFLQVNKTVTLRMVFMPTSYQFSNSLWSEAVASLTKLVTQLMERVKSKGGITDYELTDKPQSFKPGGCKHVGSRIEKIEQVIGFRTNIPLCRRCMRGWRLDTDTGMCVPCPAGYFSSVTGATECTPCPSSHPEAPYASHSLIFCFPDTSTYRERWEALPRNLFMLLAFNLFWTFLLIWNIRTHIRNVILERRGSIQITEI